MVCVLEVTEGMEAEAVEGIHRRLEVAERQRDSGAADDLHNEMQMPHPCQAARNALIIIIFIQGEDKKPPVRRTNFVHFESVIHESSVSQRLNTAADMES